MKKKVVTYLLHNMALTLLADTPNDTLVKKSAEKHRGKLFGTLTPEEREPIIMMRDAVLAFAWKLANCEDVDTLNQTYSYLKQLNAGEVWVIGGRSGPGSVWP